jgi:ribonuclease E
MANKMLIDATHPEETRVVVLRGNRVEEFDFESAHRKQLRGNIYLAKVTRVEPSLQAAFVDYGGNRHGFLAFSEIHPDYYQIPVADRQALIDEEERAQRAADDEVDQRSHRRRRDRNRPARRHDEAVHGEVTQAEAGDPAPVEDGAEPRHDHEGDAPAAEPTGFAPVEAAEAHAHSADDDAEPVAAADADPPAPTEAASELAAPEHHEASAAEIAADEEETAGEISATDHTESEPAFGEVTDIVPQAGENGDGLHADAEDGHNGDDPNGDNGNGDNGGEEEIVESVGGSDAMEEVPDRAPRYRRQYKIQEVIKRRQVMLVQVVKEERGTKGAALTTYLSLAGRYSVLMPNTARGGGISRKITSSEDRARLKEAAAELEVPEGMGVILRTAGASRTKIEIKRDFEYLLRLWETVRDLTLKSTAPKLVYEEGSLVKRSIRDLYGKEIDEVIVAGDDAYHEAKDFMRMLMPGHAKSVKLYSDTQPLLSRYGVESQLDAMFSPVVQLRSGGYIVLNQAEALVAIDVNSGRATREHHIEDTALKTNLEASDEIARQLRLRDLAGLIVIDFIDMDEKRNNRSVERRLKECLKHDRARIQVGRISHFGLLEMSRQRIRTSVLESSTEKCPYCGGSGHVRSVSSLALQVLRALEEQLMRGGTHNLVARTRPDVALYVLNQKRAHLRGLEERFAITITISADESVAAPQAFIIERGEQVHTPDAARAIAEQNQAAVVAAPLEDEDELEDEAVAEALDEEESAEASAPTAPELQDGGPRRRRRRGRGRGRGGRDRDNGNGEHREHIPINDETADHAAEPAGEFSAGEGDDEAFAGDETTEAHGEPMQGEQESNGERADGERNGERRGRRRRGRRGGRRSRHDRERNGDAAYGADTDDRGVPAPQHSFDPGDGLSPPPATEPELTGAVADLDAAPTSPAPPPAETPAVAVAVEAPPPVQQAEPPRRRSTVRERAPTAHADEAPPPASEPAALAPAPEPVVIEVTETESTADKPRKSGWWSRRFAGG